MTLASSALPSSSSSFVGTPDVVPGPRDLAGLQRDTFALMKKAPTIFVLFPILAFLPFDFANELISTLVSGDSDEPGAAFAGFRAYHRISQWIELGVGSYVAATVLSAMVAIGEGRTPTLGEAMKVGGTAWGRAVHTTFISGLIIGLSTLLFLIPGLVMATRYVLAVPASVIDGLAQTEARAKSTALVQERGAWRLFLWSAAAVLSWNLVPMVPVVAASWLTPTISPGVDAAVSALWSSVWNVVGAGLVIAAGLLYLELSGRSLQWPIGMSLRDAQGARLAGPAGTGQAGLVAVGVAAGLSCLVVVPAMVLSVAFLVAPDSVASVMAQSPLLTSLVESIAGDLDEPAGAPEGALEPAAVDAGDDVVPSGSGAAPP
jgi:hypothetical protein